MARSRAALTNLSAAAAAVALASAAGADQTFTARFNVSTPEELWSVGAADLDGDGDMDAISTGSDWLAWQENLGGSPTAFADHLVFAPDALVSSAAAADLDLDGDADVISATHSNAPGVVSAIQWHENGGAESPTFTTHEISSAGDGMLDVDVADLNGDGLPDVIAASEGDATVRWFEQLEGKVPQFTEHIVTTNSGSAMSVLASDLDDDGDQDLIVGGRFDNAVRWHENSGGPQPTFTQRDIFDQGEGFQIEINFAVADIDGDGDPDVVSSWSDDGAVRWHENLGGEPLEFQTHDVFVGAEGARGVVAKDFDGDGDPDILLASQDDDSIRWFENAGGEPAQFLPHLISTAADGARSVAAADIDGDGDLDALSASAFDDAVRWYRNDGDVWPRVCFEDRLILDSVEGALEAAAADLDGDGDTDALSGGFGFSGAGLRWHENVGGDPIEFAHWAIESPSFIESVDAADMDDDGDLDPVTAALLSEALHWYENDGSSPPSFTAHAVEMGLSTLRDAAPADVDGDGDMDLLSAWIEGVSWHENDGAATPAFTRREVAGVLNVLRVEPVDLDGDGDLDVLSTDDDRTLRWHENDGSSPPAFTPRVIAEGFEEGAFAVAAGDLDGDGDLDAIGGGVDERLLWYENDGGEPPGFTPHLLSMADGQDFTRIWAVKAGDMDGDGDPDIVTASDGGDPIRWHENIGGEPPQFVTHIASTAPDSARACAVSDFDGDGFLDILSASFDDDSVRWHENLYAIPGDLTDDGEVDGGDLGIMLGAWGPCGEGETCPADLNDDGFIDGADLGMLLGNWGSGRQRTP